MSQTTIATLRPGQRNRILEAKVYSKWISKSVPDMREIALCCILIDIENNAIQANMDVNNTQYFNLLLKSGIAYRISKFICESTNPYHQTLENKTSLKFGKVTTFDILQGQESEFPDNHFKFISYNQVPSRIPYEDENSRMIYPILTRNV
ncbi:hypothetical protein Tco_0692349 [Tanacetum coccineum]